MKNYRIMTTIFFIIISFRLLSSQPLQLKIEFDKRNYIQDEEIFVYIRLVNNSKSIVETYEFHPSFYSTDIKLKNSESIKRWGTIIHGEPRKIKIKPRSEYQVRFGIMGRFWTNNYTRPPVFRQGYLKPDTYHFKVIQMIDKNRNIESEWVPFIVEPVPPEEAGAFEMFNKIIDESINIMIDRDFQKTANNLENNVTDFIRIFSNSRYTPAVLNSLVNVYMEWVYREPEKMDKIKPRIKQLLKQVIMGKQYSGYAESKLSLLLYYMDTQEERIQFLESIKTNEKTRLQESVAEGLKDLRAGKTNIDWED